MAAKDADLARDFSLDFLYIANTDFAQFEIELLATQTQSAGDRHEELSLVGSFGTVLEAELTATPHSAAIASGPVYRMRAYDTDLSRTVYWDAANIDTADSEYGGNPLALTNIVVSVTVC